MPKPTQLASNVDDDSLTAWDAPMNPEQEAESDAYHLAEHRADMQMQAEADAEEAKLTEQDRKSREIFDLQRECIRLAAAWHKRDPSRSMAAHIVLIGSWLDTNCNDWSAFPKELKALGRKLRPYTYDHHHPELRAMHAVLNTGTTRERISNGPSAALVRKQLPGQRTKLTVELEREIVAAIDAGEQHKPLARKHQISARTIRRIKQRHSQRPLALEQA